MLYITSVKMCQERRRIRVTPLQSLFFSRFFVFYFSSRHISAPLAGLYLDPVMQTHICDSHCYITINQATLLAFARTRGRMFPETCYCNSPAEEKKKKTKKKKIHPNHGGLMKRRCLDGAKTKYLRRERCQIAP